MTSADRREDQKRSEDRHAALVPRALVESIVTHLDPKRMILFGSRARADAGPDSDIDLLIVVDDDTPAERLHWRSLHEARRGFPGAVDLVPCRESVFRDRADIVGSLPWIAASEGIVVYDRDAG